MSAVNTIADIASIEAALHCPAREAKLSDILDDLKKWRDHLAQDARHRAGELPGITLNTLNRVIEEIEQLRRQRKALLDRP
jgi:hypothetical protein